MGWAAHVAQHSSCEERANANAQLCAAFAMCCYVLFGCLPSCVSGQPRNVGSAFGYSMLCMLCFRLFQTALRKRKQQHPPASLSMCLILYVSAQQMLSYRLHQICGVCDDVGVYRPPCLPWRESSYHLRSGQSHVLCVR